MTAAPRVQEAPPAARSRPAESTPRKLIVYVRTTARLSTPVGEADVNLSRCLEFLRVRGWDGFPREVVIEDDRLGRSRAAHAIVRRAKGGGLQGVIVARLDDIAPTSVLVTLALVTKLERLGVPVYSVDEDQWFGPQSGQRRAVLQGFEWAVAKHHELASERVQATIARRRREAATAGLPFHWGRSARSLAATRPDLPAKVKALRAAGASWNEIAERLGIKVPSARRLHDTSERNNDSTPK